MMLLRRAGPGFFLLPCGAGVAGRFHLPRSTWISLLGGARVVRFFCFASVSGLGLAGAAGGPSRRNLRSRGGQRQGDGRRQKRSSKITHVLFSL